MKLITEYLIIVEKTASEAFYSLCDNVGEFNKLLQTDPNIRIEGSFINYKRKTKFAYEVRTDRVEDKDQRFFHIKVTFDSNEEDVEEYSDMLRSIRGVVHRAGGQPETLWDDVSLYYSHKAYPFIHKAENLMRKLITYFMLTNIGKEWVTETSPKVVREAIDKSKRKQHLDDVLHQVDFSHLGDFLFKAYQTKDISTLYETLDNAQKIDDLNLNNLKSFIAKSNWERYFSKIVACSDKYFDKRWRQLYDLRCMVAHNALVGKSDYDRIIQLVGEVEGHLQKAIDNINKVHVPKEDREQVAEYVASNINAWYKDFIQSWKSFDLALMVIESDWELWQVFRSPMWTLQALREKEIIDNGLFGEGSELIQFRNRLVNDASSSFSEQETRNYILRLEELTKTLKHKRRSAVTFIPKA